LNCREGPVGTASGARSFNFVSPLIRWGKNYRFSPPSELNDLLNVTDLRNSQSEIFFRLFTASPTPIALLLISSLQRLVVGFDELDDRPYAQAHHF